MSSRHDSRWLSYSDFNAARLSSVEIRPSASMAAVRKYGSAANRAMSGPRNGGALSTIAARASCRRIGSSAAATKGANARFNSSSVAGAILRAKTPFELRTRNSNACLPGRRQGVLPGREVVVPQEIPERRALARRKHGGVVDRASGKAAGFAHARIAARDVWHHATLDARHRQRDNSIAHRVREGLVAGIENVHDDRDRLALEISVLVEPRVDANLACRLGRESSEKKRRECQGSSHWPSLISSTIQTRRHPRSNENHARKRTPFSGFSNNFDLRQILAVDVIPRCQRRPRMTWTSRLGGRYGTV